MSTSTFPLFPLLPPELRLQIWAQTLTPRIITLTSSSSPTTTHTLSTTTRPPAILHASHESRAFALSRSGGGYMACTINPPKHEEEEEEEQEQQRYFHLHPALDTLYFPRPRGPGGYDGCLRAFIAQVPGAARAVRRVAVDYVPAEVRRPWEVYGKVCLLRGCARLEQAVLVVSVLPPPPPPPPSCESRLADRDGEVEFVDFAGDRAEVGRGIVGLVRESFRYELGEGWGGGGFGKDEAGKAEGGFGEALELVPKAKVVRGWRERPRVVGCAS